MLKLEILFTILSFLLSFFISYILTKWWISVAKQNKSMLQPDMNKYIRPPIIPKTGGIAVLLSIILTALVYVFFKTFILKSSTHIVETLTLMVTVFMAFLIGFIDDIFGWKNSSINGYKKVLMTVPIAVPLMVINAGHSLISLPFLGNVNFGVIYPLMIIPLIMIGSTNGFNLLAGFNGLEAGLGIIIISVLGMVAFFAGQSWLALIAGIVVFSLASFLIFNKNPAKIFPGNTLTYVIGSLIGCFAILGNIEKAALILFIPFIIEGFLKARSKFKAWNFGVPNQDNSLEPRYNRNYSLTHIVLKFLKKVKGKAFEIDIVRLILIIELILAIFVLINTLIIFI